MENAQHLILISHVCVLFLSAACVINLDQLVAPLFIIALPVEMSMSKISARTQVILLRSELHT
jgi:hypothetical protein